MKNNERLLNKKILVLDRHLMELSKNFSNDTRDWEILRIKHKQEVQLVGLLLFSDWNQQSQDIFQLSYSHKKKCVALKISQSREIAILDAILSGQVLN